MKKYRQISEITDASLEAMRDGQQNLESILEMHPQQAEKLRPGLEAAQWLFEARKVLQPRPTFISSSRSYMEDQFNATQPRGFWRRWFVYHPPRRWAFNLSAPIILVILLVLVVNSLALAARLTIPGDPLYPTKLVLEDVRLGLTTNPVNKTRLNIEASRERMSEFVELVLEGKYELLAPAAMNMEAELVATLRAISDVSPDARAPEQSMTAELKQTLANEILLLNTLKSTSPRSAHAGIEMAILDVQSVLMALR